MISKRKKTYLKAIIVLGALFAIIAVIPFSEVLKEVGGINIDKVLDAEKIVKFIALPVVIFLMSIFALMFKVKGYGDKKKMAVGVARAAYFPLVSYVIGLIVYGINIFSFSNYIDSNQGMIALSMFLGTGLVLIILFILAWQWIKGVSKRFVIILDVLFLIAVVGIVFSLSWNIKIAGEAKSTMLLSVVGEIAFVLIITVIYAASISKQLVLEKYFIPCNYRNELMEEEKRKDASDVVAVEFREFYAKEKSLLEEYKEYKKEKGEVKVDE